MTIAVSRIVDAHHHLWDLRENYYPWLSDRIGPRMYGDYSSIRRNYLTEDFCRDIGELPVVKSVHVQAEHDPTDPARETRWLQNVADTVSPGFPHAIVAYVDLSAPESDVEQVLAAHRESKNLRGVRQMVHQWLVPGMNHPIDFLSDDRWQSNLSVLRNYGLSFDLQILPAQAATAARVIERHPELQFLLVHTGQPRDRSADGVRAWEAALRRLAMYQNVAVKISGFGMFDAAWTIDTLRPVVLTAIDCFGTARAMFGSNFPVDGLMATCATVWRAYDLITAGFSPCERDGLFYANAARIYRI